ncbi:hypothetical protein [Cryobacterium psychrophilum]|uniref:Uncharacterized protein n=1 Tax=Cryobacterium psychrophilum TaxID=41988 RepID=A0A4Y8KTL3_9MICO|nr:hypothetical protein [Cryobacterium psychrophilum]TDW28870.1 hypothetical protein EDD25_0523 [Cryobacterium psychrophilum]TFD81063.1 hypothetical protein E3T53_03530 [Cryobacterium psychrophilum]
MKKSQETPEANAKPALSPQDEAHRKYRRGRIYVRTGQVLMIVGALVAIVHWLAHIEAFGPTQPELWLDAAAGYPMGAMLLISGAIIAGQKPK